MFTFSYFSFAPVTGGGHQANEQRTQRNYKRTSRKQTEQKTKSKSSSALLNP